MISLCRGEVCVQVAVMRVFHREVSRWVCHLGRIAQSIGRNEATVYEHNVARGDPDLGKFDREMAQ